MATTIRLLRVHWPSLNTTFLGIVLLAVLVLVFVPDNREIAFEHYGWLEQQAEAFPQVRTSIRQALADDGYISRREFARLEKALTVQARTSLRRALDE